MSQRDITALAARHDTQRFREYCRRGFTAFLAVPLPAIAFVGIEAELVVRVLLGERWLGAVPMVRIMCGAALVDSVGRLTGWLYTAEGHTRQQLVWSMVSTGVTVAAVLAAASHGAVSVTWAFAVAVAALAIPGIVYCLRTSLLTGREFIRAVWRPCVATAVAAGVWMLVRAWVTTPNVEIVALTVDALVFGLIYLASWVVLPGGRQAMREARELVRAIMGRPAPS